MALALAIQYAPQLQERYQSTLLNEKYRFYWNGSNRSYFIPLEQDDNWKLQYVSVGACGNVLGYFECMLNQNTMTAYNVATMRFTPEYEPEFAADMFRFVIELLFKQYGIKRIVFNVIVGNPVEQLYDRLCEKYGGRVIGTFTQEVRLHDGKLYDVKYYEMFRDKFLFILDAKGIGADEYRLFLGVNNNE